jgi:hypothetical protein
MSQPPRPTITQHNGTTSHAMYNQWRAEAIEVSGTFYSEEGQSNSNGLAHTFLGQDYFPIFTPAGGAAPAALVPPPPAGLEPQNVTNSETKHNWETWSARQKLTRLYAKDQKELAIVLGASISKTDRKNLSHTDHGMLNVTANDIYLYMKATYGTVSVQQLRTMTADLTIQYNPDAIEFPEYLANLKFTIRALAQAGQPLSMHAQVSALRSNVMKCQTFDDVLTLFDRDFATAGSQQFDNLGAILTAEAERKRTRGTTGTTGFGNAAISSTAELRQLVTDIMGEHSANAAVPAGGGSAATPRDADLRREYDALVLQLARLTKQETKTCRCGSKFTSHNPDHETCKSCYGKDKDKARSERTKEKGKGRGGENKR